METVVQPNNKIIPPVLLYLAIALERAAYYGIRSVIVLYMVSEAFAMDHQQAVSVYGWISLIYVMSSLIGAVIGDLVSGNKYTAIGGGILQIVGALLLCISATPTLYLGIGLAFFGSGLVGTNLFSLLGTHFRKQQKALDTGMTLYQVIINVGAFIGTVFIGFLTINSFRPAFILSAAFMIIATVIMFFIPPGDKDIDQDDIVNQKFTFSIGNVLIAIAIAGVFWMCYEMASGDVFYISYDLENHINLDFLRSGLQSVNQFFVLLFGIILAIVWYFIQQSRYLKLGLGFLLGAISFLMLLVIPPGGSGFGIFLFLISAVFLALAEILVTPTVLALIVKHSNPKYLAIVFAMYILPLHLLNSLVGLLKRFFYESPNTGLIIGGTLLLITAIVILVYHLITKASVKSN